MAITKSPEVKLETKNIMGVVVPKIEAEAIQKHFPEEYKSLDKYYHIYRSTYSTTVDPQTAEEIRNYVRGKIKDFGI